MKNLADLTLETGPRTRLSRNMPGSHWRKSLSGWLPVAPFQMAKGQFIKDYLTEVLKIAKGDISLAARLAVTDRKYFYEMMQTHGVDADMFRKGVIAR